MSYEMQREAYKGRFEVRLIIYSEAISIDKVNLSKTITNTFLIMSTDGN